MDYCWSRWYQAIRPWMECVVSLVVTLGLLQAPSTLAAGTLDIDSDFNRESLGLYADYQRVPESGQERPNPALLPESAWQPVLQDVPSFGFSSDRLWLRVQVHNRSTSLQQLILEIAYPPLDSVDAYLMQSDSLIAHWKMGDTLAFAQRPLQFRNFVIPFELQGSDTATLYLSIASEGSLEAPLILWRQERFIEAQQYQLMGQGLYFGVMLIMIAYNLFIFIAVRHISYLYYVGTAASCMLFVAALQGVGFQVLWPNLPRINAIAIPASIALFSVTATAFTQSLLNLKKNAPRLYHLHIAIVGLFLLILVLSGILPYRQATTLVGVTSMINACITLATGSFLLWRGVRAARFFMVGWGCLLTTFFLTGLNKFGLIPSNLILDNAVQFGSAAEILLFSFALADRINEERRAKQAAQQTAMNNLLQAEQEHARYLEIKHQNEVVELKAQQEVIAAQAESRAKSEFLATMSHEIRTPMNGVLGMAQMLQDTSLDHTQRQYVDVITGSGKALLNIINDILDYSKIVAGKLEIELIDFDLEQLCLECVSVFRQVAESKQVTLYLSIQPDVPHYIRSDPTRIRQILLNLLSNAFKFTHQGQVRLHVSRSQTQLDALQFEVMDTGIGISADAQKNLFQAFSQADKSISRQYGGTGLGLNISCRLVELLGGKLSVESAPGNGSQFRFSVALVEADADFVKTQKESAAVLQGKHLLLVAMASDISTIIMDFAQFWGMRAIRLERTSQVMASLEQDGSRDSTPDVIVVVEPLASESGQDITTAIQSKAANRPACIVLTESILEGNQLQQAGIDAVVPMLTATIQLKAVLLRFLQQATKNAPIPPALGDVLRLDKKLLVAEDNVPNQMVIGAMLKKLKLNYQLATNGEIALSEYQKNPGEFAGILMDCEMPVMDGYAATRAIRAFESTHCRATIPIVALTAHALPDRIEAAMDAGMNAVLTKPISFQELNRTLSDWLPAGEY